MLIEVLASDRTLHCVSGFSDRGFRYTLNGTLEGLPIRMTTSTSPEHPKAEYFQ